MIEEGKTYVIMGLLDTNSIAYYCGETIERLGGKVVYTVQNERMKKIFLERTLGRADREKMDSLDIKYCEVTIEEEVKALFEELGEVAGVLHSIAFANPKTCLGEEFHTNAFDDLKLGFHISCVSLATVAQYAQTAMPNGGGIVAMTFESRKAFAYYNWMSVNKAALEALTRALARRHGKDLIRVNAVSAGPVQTKAGSAIQGFDTLASTWEKSSPLPWDLVEDKQEVANAVVFLMGNFSKKITGQTLHVDGGASIIGGEIQEHERP
ncbi:MAG: SDR family oxidoreductase [Lentisphaeria bacterium]|nr:SDR family oxidoreductase [Lentisphaeria bacterium]NQZ70687.1 SDR family oxidoreductase [Lentisphaeria bacterium]